MLTEPKRPRSKVVIQTFLSSYASEERQLKGRTARQGRGGLYIQALCAVHLEGKLLQLAILSVLSFSMCKYKSMSYRHITFGHWLATMLILGSASPSKT